ncbi:MAG: sulfite exporter TauE/SafE family protein [Geminicoccaceae bacterium]
MSSESIVFIVTGAAFGGFVNGLAGFGTSLFALGWWLQVMPPAAAVAVSLAMSLINGVQGVWLVRHAMDKRRLSRFLLPALVGIPIGVLFLDHMNADLLKLIVAIFLLAYGLFFAFRRNLPDLRHPTPILDRIIGFLGGFFGAAAGLSGALPTVWLSLRPWPKTERRALLQPFNMVVLGLAALLLALKGTYDSTVLLAIAIATPAALASAQVGIYVFKRMNDADFRRLLIFLMLASGLVLLVRSVL